MGRKLLHNRALSIPQCRNVNIQTERRMHTELGYEIIWFNDLFLHVLMGALFSHTDRKIKDNKGKEIKSREKPTCIRMCHIIAHKHTHTHEGKILVLNCLSDVVRRWSLCWRPGSSCIHSSLTSSSLTTLRSRTSSVRCVLPWVTLPVCLKQPTSVRHNCSILPLYCCVLCTTMFV